MSRLDLHHLVSVSMAVAALAGCPGDDPKTAGDDTTGSATGGSPTSSSTMPSVDDDTSTSGPDDGSSGDPDDCDPPCGPDQICTAGKCVDLPPPPLCEDGWGAVGSYDDCTGGADRCNGGVCIGTDEGNVCSFVGCRDVCDCPEPADGTLVCEPLEPDGENVCFLSCRAGRSCPAGMICLDDTLCVHPGAAGFGDCVPPVPVYDCRDGEACFVDDPDEPTFGFCSATGCTDAADCPPPPATGDAPAVCGDLGAGDTCYLDCSKGQSCPDAMECVDATYCAFASFATVLDEDFEGGVLPPGWSEIDNDGQTVHPEVQMTLGVDFGDAGWVVWPDVQGTQAAVGASYYMPAGAADDWLITPLVNIAPNAVLGFQARSQNGTFAEDYEVRISSNGGAAISDFMDNPILLTVTAEPAAYQFHEVDLSAYAGMDVRLAFHLTTFDGTVLWIDNVWISQ